MDILLVVLITNGSDSFKTHNKRLAPLIGPFKVLTYLVADHKTLNVFSQIPKRLAFITGSGVTVHAVMTTPLIVTIK